MDATAFLGERSTEESEAGPSQQPRRGGAPAFARGTASSDARVVHVERGRSRDLQAPATQQPLHQRPHRDDSSEPPMEVPVVNTTRMEHVLAISSLPEETDAGGESEELPAFEEGSAATSEPLRLEQASLNRRARTVRSLARWSHGGTFLVPQRATAVVIPPCARLCAFVFLVAEQRRGRHRRRVPRTNKMVRS